MASFVDVREDLITTIPENWSMEDSVTILSTYATVWYGLIERAQLRKSLFQENEYYYQLIQIE